jgi:hypothetical protein
VKAPEGVDQTEPSDYYADEGDPRVQPIDELTADTSRPAARSLSRVLIRPARPDEYDEIGELAVRVYLAEGYTRAGSPYLAGAAATSATRAEKAELLVAVDDATGSSAR